MRTLIMNFLYNQKLYEKKTQFKVGEMSILSCQIELFSTPLSPMRVEIPDSTCLQQDQITLPQQQLFSLLLYQPLFRNRFHRQVVLIRCYSNNREKKSVFTKQQVVLISLCISLSWLLIVARGDERGYLYDNC